MPLGFFTKNRIIAIVSLILIVVLLCTGLFFYFKYLQNKNPFKKIDQTVKVDTYEKLGFSKISSDDREYSYFVPSYWTNTDKLLKLYTDSFTGSSSYFTSYPNSLGVLTDPLCKDFSSKSIEELKQNDLYKNTVLNSHSIKKVGDYEGCYSTSDSILNSKNYSIRQFYIFRKNRIYHLFIQTQSELQTQKDIADLIERSIVIEE